MVRNPPVSLSSAPAPAPPPAPAPVPMRRRSAGAAGPPPRAARGTWADASRGGAPHPIPTVRRGTGTAWNATPVPAHAHTHSAAERAAHSLAELAILAIRVRSGLPPWGSLRSPASSWAIKFQARGRGGTAAHTGARSGRGVVRKRQGWTGRSSRRVCRTSRRGPLRRRGGRCIAPRLPAVPLIQQRDAARPSQQRRAAEAA